MSIYKHKVSLAPKQFVVLPRFDLPMSRFMIRFALCSRTFHFSVGLVWTFAHTRLVLIGFLFLFFSHTWQVVLVHNG